MDSGNIIVAGKTPVPVRETGTGFLWSWMVGMPEMQEPYRRGQQLRHCRNANRLGFDCVPAKSYVCVLLKNC